MVTQARVKRVRVRTGDNLPLHRGWRLFRFAIMFSMKLVSRWCALAVAGVLLCGCLPSSQGPLDEQKEMHFLTGKARANGLDYPGAIEAFERALEVNPKNASAHFELGLIYEREQVGDYSAAIYHFERFLKLRPQSDYAQLVRERISTDKIELSKTTVLPPVTPSMQREFDRLAEENKQLRVEAEKWRAEAEKWQSYYASRSREPAPGTSVTPPPLPPNPRPADPSTGSPARPALRTHAVKSGDTLTSIAGRYGVRLEALTAVNPGLDPRKMRIGQVINIPAN